MKILVIKQTSLGDVLHSTGHVRALKKRWPESELVLLTASGSREIYRHNPWVDKMILVDRARVKRDWWRNPGWSWGHMRDVMHQVRQEHFDLAFDLQGLAKSVCFLYGARAAQKYVKGRWPGIPGFRNPGLHAIKEMDGVLALAGLTDVDTSMEFATSAEEINRVESLLTEINPAHKPVLILSPFSRWRSKDWPIERFCDLANRLQSHFEIIFTGAPDRKEQITEAIRSASLSRVHNLSGDLNLIEFAELVRRAKLMVTGDSFPMHIASAVNTPVVALFGPTDEARVGPTHSDARVIRAPGCAQCDRRNCPRQCLDRVTVQQVESLISE